MNKIISIYLVWVLLLSCSPNYTGNLGNPQLVEVIFSFDSSIEKGVTWSRKPIAIAYGVDTFSLVIAQDVGHLLIKYCEDTVFNTIRSEGVSIYSTPQYSNGLENNLCGSLEQHCGGDIYISNENKITIQFFVEAKSIQLDSVICDDLKLTINKDCPVESAVNYPYLLIGNVKSSKSLTASQMSLRSISKAPFDNFTAYYCD